MVVLILQKAFLRIISFEVILFLEKTEDLFINWNGVNSYDETLQGARQSTDFLQLINIVPSMLPNIFYFESLLRISAENSLH